MTNLVRFQKILEPIRIGDMTLKNRIVMAPIVDNFDSDDGYPTERKRRYLEARAKGGPGLIVIGSICVDSRLGRAHKSQLLIDDDKFIPGLRVLVRTIQRYGAKVCAQLHHFGAYSNPEITHIQNVAPSAFKAAGRPAREMTVDEIKDAITRHVNAVVRAKKAGFDAVQIMMSGGYLLNSFLSPVTNKRQDAYGGELRNRARICLEIIREAREKVGQSFPISAKISPSEKGAEYGIEGCFTIEEGKAFARMLEDAGVSFLNIQSRGFIKTADGLGPNYYLSFPNDPGPFISDVIELKKVVNVPIMTVGRLNPRFAEQLLQENKLDLVGVARGFLADPEFANKVASGTVEDITPCINCLRCADKMSAEEPLGCSVNPALGREAEYEIRLAERKKRVLIVGGGPAGMEAARIAALRGHEVVLYEKSHRLGGQLLAAGMAPKKGDIEDLTDYLETQIRKLDVKVELRKEATSIQVEEAKPDGVIIATGASHFIPEIPGIDGNNVVMAEDVLLGKGSVGQKTVVIGGGVVGCETADYLSEKGKRVIIVEMLGELAPGISNVKKKQLIDRLKEKGVTLLTNTTCQEITGNGVVITSQEGERKSVEVDTVVLAAGAKSNTQLIEALEDKPFELYLIGDCVEPRKIAEAIDEAFRVGCLI